MKKIYYISVVISAVSLFFSGCAKENGFGTEASLSFSANVSEIVQVKAVAVTGVTDFFAAGYDGSTQWFPECNVQLSEGSRTFDSYKWEKNVTKTFYAYSNNLPASDASATITSDGVKLEYAAIPPNALNQADVLLGGYYGNGNNEGTAVITFYHPLSQLVFNVGRTVNVTAINGINIEGVYSTGYTSLSSTAVASGSPSFVWNGTGSPTMVSQTISGDLPPEGDQLGIPFMLIPQDFATNNIKVVVSATVAGGGSETFSSYIKSGALVSGKSTVCTLNVFSAGELDISCTLSNYSENADDIDIFD